MFSIVPRLEPTSLVLDYLKEKVEDSQNGQRHSRHAWTQKISIPKGNRFFITILRFMLKKI